MRLMDILLAFPGLILAIAIVTVLGSGLFKPQLAIGIVAIPIYARVMRGVGPGRPRAGLRHRRRGRSVSRPRASSRDASCPTP